jgi:hypothetical protein
MVFIRALLAFALLALWIYCIVDVLTRTRGEFRTLPKYGWLPIVVLLPGIGSLLWLLTGRAPAAGEHPVVHGADDNEAYLRGLRERAEQQRRAAERQKRRRADEEERGELGD